MSAKSKPAPLKPTSGELEILDVIWRRGPATVRDVHGELAPVRQVGYTTVLKLMQIMADKGLLRREESGRAHVYVAAVQRGDAQRRAVRELAKALFGGSAARLALQALDGASATPEELAEIRRLLNRYERGER